MAKVIDTEQPSESENTRSAPSAVKLKQMIGTSPAYRMLTPEEIELLRKIQTVSPALELRTPCRPDVDAVPRTLCETARLGASL